MELVNLHLPNMNLLGLVNNIHFFIILYFLSPLHNIVYLVYLVSSYLFCNKFEKDLAYNLVYTDHQWWISDKFYVIVKII